MVDGRNDNFVLEDEPLRLSGPSSVNDMNNHTFKPLVLCVFTLYSENM